MHGPGPTTMCNQNHSLISKADPLLSFFSEVNVYLGVGIA